MKKVKFTLFALFYLLVTKFSYCYKTTDDACSGEITLSSQAEVDAFNCVEVIGPLTISGPDITNLDGLSELRSVGSLRISNNDNLTNVDGLSSLVVVAGYQPETLVISGNAVLKNLDGLSAVSSINGNLIVSSNASLQTVHAFTLVTRLETLIITNNPALTSIAGLANVTSLSSGEFFAALVIEGNSSLKNLDGLSSLRTIGGRFANVSISNNASLENIDGLSSLTSISGGPSGSLEISNNLMLRNLNGLSSLTTIGTGMGGPLRISNNSKLENIDGLSALEFMGGGGDPSIILTDNPSLTRCCGLYPFLSATPNQGAGAEISGNGAGCTLEDILGGGPCLQSISSFSLINERTGVVIKDFYDSITLDRADPDFFKWTIQANAFPETVGSVVLRIDKKFKQTENTFPYTLRKHVLPFLKSGVHSLTTEIYSKPHKKGEQGIGRTATIIITNSAAILNFEVVDTSGKALKNLKDGDEINIKDPAFNSISILANTTPDTVGSVKFFLNHRYYRTENMVPYALNGDKDGDYYPWIPRPGSYMLMATPYSKRNGRGYSGKPLILNFKVIADGASLENKPVVYAKGNTAQAMPPRDELSVSIYPVPTDGHLFVKLNYPVNSKVMISIKNIHGQQVYMDSYSTQQLENYRISTVGLKPGVYYLQILTNNGVGQVVKFIKK